ncbi:SMI1/KNR4 family protein [Janthinobacterium sp. PLB04]|uniref:SMI1/KNR4 family protein n=1 Tax=Janthinobacterium lividum TaxID=29581 RepID=A0AAJ4MPY0_9BURK|nr:MULTISPECIES: SMI1/KNR4 family protein [Janthinobacterium]KAB0325805.1 SMI1/KNR4 family protein [Janthinobacterium lividum]QSX94920.1 SMI1/KNR4 family protein [Janthinobacterium lividum]UGQ34737.1 SMI1/KNR4 family protein [Janthinobacterium sp. PLB04]
MSGQAIDAFQRWLGHALPAHYLRFLQDGQEGLRGGQVLLYGVESLRERNETYDTQQSCPGYMTIGDDSGGRAVMLALDDAERAVYLVGHGSMQRDDFELAADDFVSWLAADCPLD